jgi:hypothetical protein
LLRAFFWLTVTVLVVDVLVLVVVVDAALLEVVVFEVTVFAADSFDVATDEAELFVVATFDSAVFVIVEVVLPDLLPPFIAATTTYISINIPIAVRHPRALCPFFFGLLDGELDVESVASLLVISVLLPDGSSSLRLSDISSFSPLYSYRIPEPYHSRILIFWHFGRWPKFSDPETN